MYSLETLVLWVHMTQAQEKHTQNTLALWVHMTRAQDKQTQKHNTAQYNTEN